MTEGLVIGNPRTKIRAGRCYELSFRAMLNEQGAEEWILVHGTGRAPGGRRIDHAWIEAGNQVYDPVADQWFVRERYLMVNAVAEHARYSRTRAVKIGVAAGHYGPWHDPWQTDAPPDYPRPAERRRRR